MKRRILLKVLSIMLAVNCVVSSGLSNVVYAASSDEDIVIVEDEDSTDEVTDPGDSVQEETDIVISNEDASDGNDESASTNTIEVEDVDPVMATEGDFEYTTYDVLDKTYVTISKYKGTATKLTIPGTISGYPVKKIGDDAFKGNIVISSVSIPDSVIEIGSYAFNGCTSLSSVKLSNSLETIGKSAFRNSGLTYIKIPKSVKEAKTDIYGYSGVFSQCSNLTTIEFESGSTSIPRYICDDADSIKSIVIPESVVEIGSNAFEGCDNLKIVSFPTKLTTIYECAFRYCKALEKVELPNSVIYIGYRAFENCEKLTTVSLSNNLETLGWCAFANTAIKSIRIPKSLTKVEIDGFGTGKFFSGCANLETIEFEEGRKNIPRQLFEDADGLKSIKIPNGVETIESGAFKNCDQLVSVSLPDSLTLIDADAFRLCASLTKITVPNNVKTIGNYAFEYCTKLATVSLPNKLELLGYYAFANTAIYSIKIPKSLKTVSTTGGTPDEGMVFSGCLNLETVEFEEGITRVISHLFEDADGLKKIVIPEGVEVIEPRAFRYCDSLSEVILPDSLTTIGYDAFFNCKNLRELTSHNNITIIGSGAFQNCEKLTEVSLSNKLETIGCYAFANTAIYSIKIPRSLKVVDAEKKSAYNKFGNVFAGCLNLKKAELEEGRTDIPAYLFDGAEGIKEVVIPTSVERIEDYAFRNCSSLETATLPKFLKYLGTSAFQNCSSLKGIIIPEGVEIVYDNTYRDCASATSIAIPDTVKEIGEYSFAGCKEVTSLELPSSVASINDYAFSYCDKLTTVRLSTGMTAIPKGAFNSCLVLNNVIIPYGVTYIGDAAFVDCAKLRNVTIPKTVTDIHGNAFSELSELTVYGVADSYAETWAKEKKVTFVAIDKHAEKIELSRTSLKLANGSSERIAYKVTPEDCTDDVVWRSSNKEVATVEKDGTVKAAGVGETTVKIYIGDDASAECKVTVVQPVTNIVLNAKSCDLEAYDTVQLTATVYPDNAFDKTYTWSTSDENVATVNENGLVTAVAKGKAIIKATANDGSEKYGACTINVTRDVINCKNWTELESDHKYKSNTDLVWRYQKAGASKLTLTFDEKTSFDDGGDYLYVYTGDKKLVNKYTGKELAGKTVEVTGDTVKIQLVSDEVITDWGFKVTNVTTGESNTPVIGVTISPKELILIENGSEVGFKVQVLPETATNKNYTVKAADEKIAVVSDNKSVKPVQAGKTTITVTTQDGNKTDTAEVYVRFAKPNASQNKDKLEGLTAGASYTITPAKGTARTVTADATGIITMEDAWFSTTLSIVRIHKDFAKCNSEEQKLQTGAKPVIPTTGLYIAFEGNVDKYTYTGTAIKPGVIVCYNGQELKENADYIVSYSNNINAGKAAATITLKGDYSGRSSKNFTIESADINNAAVIVKAVNETGKEANGTYPKATATVSYMGKTLSAGKDYTFSVDWKATPEIKKETVTVKGKTTEVEVKLYPVSIKAVYKQTKKSQAINFKGENTSAKIKVYPKGKKAVTDSKYVDLKKGSIEFATGLSAHTYKGSAWMPVVNVYAGKGSKKGEAIKSKNYRVTYSSNVNKGTATVTVTGIESMGYMGTLTKKFTIKPFNLGRASSQQLVVEMPDAVEYTKGGVKPSPVVKYKTEGENPVILRENVDYKLSYSGNNKVGVTGKGAPKVTIKGLGNFNGSISKSFKITQKDISKTKIMVVDKAVKNGAKGNYFISKPTVYDENGNKLAAKTDYTAKYYYKDVEIGKTTTISETDATIKVVISGTKAYTGTATAYYKVRTIKNLSAVKVEKIKDKEFTGKAIRPDSEVKLYTTIGKGKNPTKKYLTAGKDFEITLCYNNVNKGTATYLLRGIGEYSGYKTLTFKIVQAKVQK